MALLGRGAAAVIAKHQRVPLEEDLVLKYLILHTPNGEAPVLFPRAFAHAYVAQLFKPMDVAAAGFVSGSGERLQCHGASAGLHIASRPAIDAALIADALSAGPGTGTVSPPLPAPPPAAHDR